MNRQLQTLRHCVSGNVGMMFGLALLPIAIAAGSALDYSTASNVRSKLQLASDAAAVAGDAVAPWSVAACEEQARKYFKSNVNVGLLSEVPTPIVNCAQNGTTVTVEGQVSTSLLGVMGIDTINVAALSKTTCQLRNDINGTEPMDPILWHQPGTMPNQTRVVTLGEFQGPVVRYRMTPEGRPIVRLDNPYDGPATITLRSVPNSPVGNMSFSVPERGQFIVIIPWIPNGQVSWWVEDGPHPKTGGSATWVNNNRVEWTPDEIPGNPIYDSVGTRYCWISQ